jgi:hypothetical protein
MSIRSAGLLLCLVLLGQLQLKNYRVDAGKELSEDLAFALTLRFLFVLLHNLVNIPIDLRWIRVLVGLNLVDQPRCALLENLNIAVVVELPVDIDDRFLLCR